MEDKEFIRRRGEQLEEEKKVEVNNFAGMAVIEFDTSGRFSLPKTMHFNDFKGRDINDLTLSRTNDTLETLVKILNQNKHEAYKDVDVLDATPEELLEILANIKANFQADVLPFYWICDCQKDVDENSREINTDDIELDSLKFTTIEEADKKLQDFYKKKFESNSKNFELFLKIKYKDETDFSKYVMEEELEKIQVKEPFDVKDHFGNVYSFEFPRIRHMVVANKMVEDKYYGKIKNIQSRKEHNVPLAELQKKKEQLINEVEREKGKDFIAYTKGLAMISKNGKPLTNAEKIEEISEMSGSIFVDLTNTLDEIRFGLNDERELTCPICGKKSKRSLRREFDIQYLLPTNTTTKRKSGKHSELNIFIGA